MGTLGVCIVVAVILFILDRNHVWPQVWKGVKRIVKVTTKIAVAVAVVCAIVYGISYTWGQITTAREKREQAAAAKVEKDRADKAIADRWAELSSVQKAVCGDKIITVSLVPTPQGYPDDTKPWPAYGVVGCTTHQEDHPIDSDILPPSEAGCAALQSTIPTFTCKLPPPIAVRTRESGAYSSNEPWKNYAAVVPNDGHRHVTAKYNTDITTSEYGALTCGHISAGETATLLEEGNTGIKIRTKTGQVGWAASYQFEVNH